MDHKHLLAGTLTLIAISAALAQDRPQTAPQSAPPKTNKQAAAPVHTSHQEDEGQRIFEQNCSRCHTAPEGFSPRISGTIVRHMRVRASLSQHDEEELLHFFNP